MFHEVFHSRKYVLSNPLKRYDNGGFELNQIFI